ncbi:hypothetical protein [Arsenicibacter rosenii]|uniref:ABC transporter ATPase n=1 Tax=Arsenicibacter rosenii TaxID=1750698 RepID=A0A1S2VAP2_9BACT|nr:hypothetical protein [Arsenicibacter rosenii]OIN55807.1 hypothetical protein BLX24_27965 [Arsenicibacter rosenii]
MYIDFNEITDTARLWVYQANRTLTDAEVQQIDAALRPALSGWAAHGEPLLAAAQVVANRFVVIAVDEGHHLPSGCSIDSSVGFLRQISATLSQQGEAIDFFDRSAAYLDSEKQIQTVTLPNIKAAVADGRLTPETLVVNTLVNTKATFLADWLVPAQTTWLKRYFIPKTVSV